MLIFSTGIPVNSSTLYFTLFIRLSETERIFTPYEQDEKFSDESVFENGSYPIFAYIRNAIELPNGDVLLRLEETEPIYDRLDDEKETSQKSYIYERLSDICIRECDCDNEITD